MIHLPAPVATPPCAIQVIDLPEIEPEVITLSRPVPQYAEFKRADFAVVAQQMIGDISTWHVYLRVPPDDLLITINENLPEMVAIRYALGVYQGRFNVTKFLTGEESLAHSNMVRLDSIPYSQ